jgi:hypothetical protein
LQVIAHSSSLISHLERTEHSSESVLEAYLVIIIPDVEGIQFDDFSKYVQRKKNHQDQSITGYDFLDDDIEGHDLKIKNE